MIAQITFNRSAKQYQFIHEETGEILTAPAGQKAKLFQGVVAMLDPDLFAAALNIIDTHPQLERGAWKAVEIVAGDGVEIFPGMRGNVYAMVASSDGMGRYAIAAEDGYTTCQCEHFASFNAPMVESGNRYCKHILAYHLTLVTRSEY